MTPPAADEVRVEMAFAALNPFDVYNARSDLSNVVSATLTLPRTLGLEGSGRIDGKPVIVSGHGLSLTRDGTWSAALNVPRPAVAPLPDGISLAVGAVTAHAGATAWAVGELAEIHDRDRVLVLGAAGGVGSMLVGLASRRGAEVWALTAFQDKAEELRNLGAHHVAVGGPEALSGISPTIVLDSLGGLYTVAAVETLAVRGRLILSGTSSQGEASLDLQSVYRKGLTVRGFSPLSLSPEERGALVRRALRAVADGELWPHVSTELPLDQVNDAIDLLVGRTVIGKIVLSLGT
jgi:NADPH2:quinone reductase